MIKEILKDLANTKASINNVVFTGSTGVGVLDLFVDFADSYLPTITLVVLGFTLAYNIAKWVKIYKKTGEIIQIDDETKKNENMNELVEQSNRSN